MNAATKIDLETSVNMTSKGQVLIPKAVRDRAGLHPGAAVKVGLNDRGEAVVLPADSRRKETPEERAARRRAAMEALGRRYSTGRSTDDYMAQIREPYDDYL